MRYNFERWANIAEFYLSTELLDIMRPVGGITQVVHANIPCSAHIARMDSSDPNSGRGGIQPVKESLYVDCLPYVDIRVGDYLIAKQLDSSGNVVHVMTGWAGNPRRANMRKAVDCIIYRQGGVDDGIDFVPPPQKPPENTVKIQVNFFDMETKSSIAPTIEKDVAIGYELILGPLDLVGYDVVEVSVNGETRTFLDIYETVQEAMVVNYYYSSLHIPVALRVYNSGSFEEPPGVNNNGLHLHKLIPVSMISNYPETKISFNIPYIEYTHLGIRNIPATQRQVLIGAGTRIRMFDVMSEYVVTSTIPDIDGYIVEATEVVASDREKEAIIARMYDDGVL